MAIAPTRKSPRIALNFSPHFYEVPLLTSLIPRSGGRASGPSSRQVLATDISKVVVCHRSLESCVTLLCWLSPLNDGEVKSKHHILGIRPLGIHVIQHPCFWYEKRKIFAVAWSSNNFIACCRVCMGFPQAHIRSDEGLQLAAGLLTCWNPHRDPTRAIVTLAKRKGNFSVLSPTPLGGSILTHPRSVPRRGVSSRP